MSTTTSTCLCSVCGKRFRKPSFLQRHELVHAVEKPFQCAICYKGFTQKSSLLRHNSHNHKGERKFKCPKCQMSFTQKANLATHLKNTHLSDSNDGRMFPCTKCSCVFSKLYTLNRHKYAIHPASASVESKWDQLQNAFQDDAPVDDPDELAQNVLEELKRLQCGMEQHKETPQIGEIQESTNQEIQNATQVEEVTTVDSFITNIVTLQDSLNPKSESNSISVQRIQREDGFKYYVCEFCAKEFQKSYHFIRHRRTHTDDRPYNCIHCEKRFKTKTKQLEHNKMHFLDERFGMITKQLTCFICTKNYSSVRQFDVHMRDHYDTHKVQYTCSVCYATFTTKEAHSNHRHAKEDMEMEMLNTLLPEPISLNENFKEKSGKEKKKNKKENKRKSSEQYQCSTCKRFFSTKSSLNVHTKIHFGRGEHFACVHCSQKKFSTKSKLQRHLMLQHSESRNFKCVYCEQTFKTKQHCKSHMKGHLKRLLNNTNEKETTDRIQATTTEGDELTKCLVVVDAIEPNGGDVSTSKFIEIQMLPKCQKHKHQNITIEQLTQTTVPEDKPEETSTIARNTCNFCDKQFRKPCDLKRHLRKHTKERPFACSECNKCFALKSTLQEHRMTHQMARPTIACQVCGKKYASKKVLAVHLRLHTGERRFKCDSCDKTFRTSGHRLSHMKVAGH